MTRPIPRAQAPALEVPLIGGGSWRLADDAPEAFSMIVFYRGLHCPICGTYLRDLDTRVEALAEAGVSVVAVSSDTPERAEEANRKWRLANLKLGHSMSIDTARQWGLYVSHGHGKTSIGIEEPETFSEPGLFLIKPDKSFYYVSVQSMPFARPSFDELMKAIAFVTERNYPARGEA